MKKIFLPILTASLFIITANAQIKKGSAFLGGDISAFTQKTELENSSNIKSNGINLSPVFGKFIKDNFVVGGNIGIGISDAESDLIIESKIRSYSAGAFVRKYRNIGGGGFYIFLQGGLSGSFTKQQTDGPFTSTDDEINRITIGATAYPGVSFAVSKKLHLETGFNNLISFFYFSEKRDKNNSGLTDYTTTGFSISSSLNNATSSLYLGFRLLIGK